MIFKIDFSNDCLENLLRCLFSDKFNAPLYKLIPTLQTYCKFNNIGLVVYFSTLLKINVPLKGLNKSVYYFMFAR